MTNYPFGNAPSKIARYRAFWNREAVVRPLAGFSLVGWFPLNEFSARDTWGTADHLTPDMIDVEAFLPDHIRTLREDALRDAAIGQGTRDAPSRPTDGGGEHGGDRSSLDQGAAGQNGRDGTTGGQRAGRLTTGAVGLPPGVTIRSIMCVHRLPLRDRRAAVSAIPGWRRPPSCGADPVLWPRRKKIDSLWPCPKHLASPPHAAVRIITKRLA